MTPAQIRAQAATILASLVKQQGSLASLLPKPGEGTESADGQALLRELCFGTCRWFFQLESQLAGLLDKPIRRKDADIHCLLLIGLYQLQHLRLPDYAAINETVNAAVTLKKVWAKRLINGVLRQWQRQQHKTDDTGSLLDDAAALADSYPFWLRSAITQAWPDRFSEVLKQGNVHPPMTLRVNLSKISRDAYLEQLAGQGISASAGKLSDSAIYLEKALSVHALPGFAEGWVSIQDEASQLIPALLAPQPGDHLLDACAAPGGKTAHLLESQPELASLLALDSDSRRLQRVHQNLQRLQLHEAPVTVVCADAGQPDSWWSGDQFDRILLDAPCSATGVIRRQPDIKVLRKSEHIDQLLNLQARLLDAMWLCLAPGGVMLYTTCSILPAENAQQLESFLERTPDAECLPLLTEHHGEPWAADCETPGRRFGRQLLPSDGGPDGFYYALLKKQQ
ncbi:MAG: 16S rRNA (cytosine(967)-C(5))-methyltransferase RsmB [Pseudomonadota bacterium]|nr:16S rRNA (cytosine(967)-C(5))-methyltransferase RsmB [Pseudomonadota bacterium]